MSYVRLDYLNRYVHLARTQSASTHTHASSNTPNDPRLQSRRGTAHASDTCSGYKRRAALRNAINTRSAPGGSR